MKCSDRRRAVMLYILTAINDRAGKFVVSHTSFRAAKTLEQEIRHRKQVI